ncbi:MAG: phosphatidylglycerophosphatase A [Proteobacteria bacterium]|nr:phosphatidylglycerophosphatase A [Pseudomonadota bacterium]
MFRNARQYKLHNVINAKRLPFKFDLNPSTIICTWFYCGASPIAPGTIGSLGAYPVFYYILNNAKTFDNAVLMLHIITALIFIMGWLATAAFHQRTLLFDHQSIVIDEVAGQLLTCTLTFPWLYELYQNSTAAAKLGLSFPGYVFLICFIAFRYFDITKPLFLRYIDKNFKTAFGVMIDDIFAGLFAVGTIYILCAIHAAIV